MPDLPEALVPSQQLRVFDLDPETDSRWERFVVGCHDGLVFHHPAWAEVLERESGVRPLILACEDGDGRLRGVLPLLRTRGFFLPVGGALTGRRLSSLPRTPVAGPLALDREAAVALIQAAVARVDREPGLQLQIKVQTDALDGLVDGVVGVGWRQTYVLELPDKPETVRFGDSRNHARIKWAVSKATRLGVQVRLAETEADLRAWYVLYLETMRFHVVPPRSYRFFVALWEVLRPRGLMRLLVAEQHEAGRSKLLAGSIYLMLGRTVFYAFNGVSRASLSLRPNDVLQWQAIHDACRDGFRYYDLGEVVETNQGLAEFKSKWGAEPQRLYRYYYPPPRRDVADTYASQNRVFRIAYAAWQRLPLSVTSFLGERFYHYI